MRDSRPSLILFITASVLAIIARIFNLELLLLLAKPMVVPAIFYYYLQTKRKKTNALFVTVLWLFFVGDMIMVLFPRDGILSVMLCTMVCYAILIKFAIEDCGIIKFNTFNIIFLSLLLLLLSYILFTILNLNIESIISHYLIYLVYGIILIVLVAICTFNYLSNSNATFLHLCSMALCMLVSDLFYCINKFIIELPIIDHINLFSQFMSYFFMVKYFNSRKKSLLRSSRIKKMQ
ncbi:MAG TPA: lysoplasmalogenase family protein [Flavobacterium sp.]|nr:lysoplasmalogenase family protein [Flavobacterium sp.]